MTMDHDETVRRALQDLRVADEAQAPDFGAVLARPSVPYRLVPTHFAMGAIAAGIVIVAGAAVVRQVTKPARLVVPQEVIALSSWRPMTDLLLNDLVGLPPKDSKSGVILAPPTRDTSPE